MIANVGRPSDGTVSVKVASIFERKSRGASGAEWYENNINSS